MRCENCAGLLDDEHVCPSDDVRCVQLRAEVARLKEAEARAERAERERDDSAGVLAAFETAKAGEQAVVDDDGVRVAMRREDHPCEAERDALREAAQEQQRNFVEVDAINRELRAECDALRVMVRELETEQARLVRQSVDNRTTADKLRAVAEAAEAYLECEGAPGDEVARQVLCERLAALRTREEAGR